MCRLGAPILSGFAASEIQAKVGRSLFGCHMHDLFIAAYKTSNLSSMQLLPMISRCPDSVHLSATMIAVSWHSIFEAHMRL